MEETVYTNKYQHPAFQKQGKGDHIHCIYVHMLPQGKLSQAVIWVVVSNKGRLLQQANMKKTGNMVREVLSKINQNHHFHRRGHLVPTHPTSEYAYIINLDITLVF